MTDPWKKFLQEELNNEANQIEKEVNSDASVDNIKATPKMYEELMAKIQEAEAGKEGEKYKGLTEEELEYLRIGRELKENGGKIIYTRRKMPKRKALVLAAIMVVLVVGAGVTSVGGPQHLMEVFTGNKGGNKEQMHLDSSGDKTKRLGSKEENAYLEIKEELGIEPVRMFYLPEGATFKSINRNELANMILLEYSYHDKNLVYQIVPSSRARASSVDIADELIGSYEIDNNNTLISIKEYKVSNSNDLQYFAYFENQNQYYLISAIMDREEFDKIINNLKIY